MSLRFSISCKLPLGLPDDAIAPVAQGQLGFGASYFAANHRNTNAGMVFAKQGFVRFKRLGGVEGQSLKLGRMELIDGTDVTPKDGTLAALKRDRIAHRLIGNFGFSDVGRSFDGVQYNLNRSKLNLTLFGGRPTRGVFQVDGWGELNINVFYGALTGQVGGKESAGEWRIFGLGYQDLRDGVLKTDNRPVPVRTADTAHINIGTFGGHYIHTIETRAGQFDALAWVALQTGSWGILNQRAGAFAAEAGWQPRFLAQLKPWFRGGYDYGSGDKNAGDSTHGTFFQVLPTPRVYARFPFFNMMNNRDVFGDPAQGPARGFPSPWSRSRRRDHDCGASSQKSSGTPGMDVLVHWAQSVGPHTAGLIARILEDKPHPEMGYRGCLGVMRLAKQYSPARMEAAAERALLTGACRYQSVKSILKNSLDTLPVGTDPSTPTPSSHVYVRGSEYFK